MDHTIMPVLGSIGDIATPFRWTEQVIGGLDASQ